MHMSSTRNRIDRLSDHTCDGLATDAAYLKSKKRPQFVCVNCNAEIPVHYAQFSSLCADCRIECTDESDVKTEVCNYCNETINEKESEPMMTETETPVANGTIDLEAATMPTGVTHIVTFEKAAGRALDDDKSDSQIAAIMAAGVGGERGRRGWSAAYVNLDPEIVLDDDHFDRGGRLRSNRYRVAGNKSTGYVYSVDVRIVCTPSKLRGTLGAEFDNIVAIMDEKAQMPANRWRVAAIDDRAYVAKEIQQLAIDPSEAIGYAPFEIPSDDLWITAFDHLYGLEDYIQIIKSTLEAAEMSGWQKRVNIALVGPPACGKSDICKSLKRLLGEESVLEFDGTSTTAAGAQQMLAEREELPRVMLIEEIEKAPEASLQWLLSVLDLRGEVRKTTARGNILRDVHMVGICTVNNDELFERLASGALASRFSMPLYFNRPSRDILYKILNREVRQIGGDIAWIEPTLTFAEEMDISDPRKIIAYCLTGREKLLDGSYQAMLRRVMRGTSRPRHEAV